MTKYNVVISEQAQQDLRDLSHTISFEFNSPVTAVNYLRGIYAEIKKLRYLASIFPTQKSAYYEQYNCLVRRLRYKKMTILYTVVGRTAYIIRVIPSSSITTH